MRALRGLLLALCTALLCATLVPGARAGDWDKKTVVTFNEPVEIPGQVLPAGTYVLRLYDSASDRHIVQVWNQDQTKLFATILAIPDYRLHPADQPILTFEERPGDSPQVLRAWFYPGDNYGQEFVYPQSRAMELATATNTSVPAMPNDFAASNTSNAPGDTTPAALAQADVTTATPQNTPQPQSTNQSQATQSQTPAPSTPAQTNPSTSPESEELPKTASTTPLIGLIGMLSLGAALGMGLLAKRVA